ncbi:hypothetical protein BV20DRAFT_968469 [Pilatotrama ljubarskyi]|nr:hypothetical protein BV20DRAFT_968469 [Pilatotrama ljubarskyi]
MAGKPTARDSDHQVFLIARVKSKNDTTPTYRCVGAFRDEAQGWSSESFPLVAANRFLSLILQEENAAVVQGELYELDGKYDHPSAKGANAEKSPPVPCPYTVSLLSMAWTTAKEGGIYLSAWPMDVGLLDANLGCWDLHSTHGHAVIDISDPKRPAYCFLIDPLTPILSAYEYLSQYCDLTGAIEVYGPRRALEQFMDYLLDRAGQLIYITELSGYPLLPLSALREAWPGSDFTDRTMSNTISVPGWVYNPTVFVFLRYVRLSESPHGPILDPPADWEVARAEVLLGIVLKVLAEPVVEEGLRERCGEIVTSVLRNRTLSDFVLVPSVGGSELTPPQTVEETVQRRLCPLSPLLDDWLHAPTRGTHYLSTLEVVSRPRTAPSDIFLDLSRFPSLSARQIYRVLKARPHIQSLSLARNSQAGAGEVMVFHLLPGLKRMNIMGCSLVDDKQLHQELLLLSGHHVNIEGIWHPSFLTIHKPPFYPVAFTFMFADYKQLSGITLPFFTPTQILQALARFLPSLLQESVAAVPLQERQHFQTAGGYFDMSALERIAFNALSCAPRPSCFRRPSSRSPAILMHGFRPSARAAGHSV